MGKENKEKEKDIEKTKDKVKEKKYYLFEIDMVPMNILSIIIFVVLIIFSYLLFPDIANPSKINLVLLLILYFGYMCLHEIFHSIAYKLYGGDFKKIIYGAYLEKGVFYCQCKQNITRKNILNALMFPLFYLGIATFIIAVIFKLPVLLFLSILNLSGCAGDIVMFMYIIKLKKNIEFSEFDNPIQFAIYSNEDVSKIKHFGLKFIETTDKLERKDLKKITISKGTIIVLIIFAIIGILSVI